MWPGNGDGALCTPAAASFLKICMATRHAEGRMVINGAISELQNSREHTWMNTSDDWPPLTAHLPSMIVIGTPVMPCERALLHISSTSFSSSSERRNARAYKVEYPCE